MRKGDIIVNPWVSRCFNGKLNPNYATIYLGNNESLAYTGEVCGWADKVYKNNPDRQTPWKVIGHIDLDTIIETAIREAVKTEPSDSEKPNNSTCSKMEQVDKDTNVRSKYDCKTCKHDLWHTPRMCGKCVKQEDGKPSMYEPKTEPQTDEEYINNLPWTEAGNGEQTDIEIARAIVHKAIDDTPIAEDAYPDLRQKMHDAVDNYEPQTDCAWKKGE